MDGFTLSEPASLSVVATHNRSQLLVVNDSSYALLRVLLLRGSRFEVGQDYGVLVGQAVQSTCDAFFAHIFTKQWEVDVLEVFLDWQWRDFLSVQLPDKTELSGIASGGQLAGVPNLATLVARITVVANFPGDIESNVEILLESELIHGLSEHVKRLGLSREGWIDLLTRAASVWRHHCSWFATWGSRTQNGALIAARNLDWEPNTGIHANKLVTVWQIDADEATGDAPYAHASFGFAGLYGALVGMSSQGLTVHEPGLDSVSETFLGFPWILRLRWIMENCASLAEVEAYWKQSNNTLGMNHMVSSASDVKTGHAALGLETKGGYTAYFRDNDPREADLVYYNSSTGVYTRLGFPLPEALWRTNHGYDPEIVHDLVDPTVPGCDTEVRYMILADSFAYYEATSTKIGVLEAVNRTSLAGAKGGEHFFECLDSAEGSNILSVVMFPSVDAGEAYVAWGRGSGDSWRPACCGDYVHLPIGDW